MKIYDEIKKLHDLNIGHFDIKPDNFLFDTLTGAVHLIDFGTSRFLKSKHDMVQERLGTPEYSAPESFNILVGLKTDHYSLGKIIKTIICDIPNENIVKDELNNEIAKLIIYFCNRLQGLNWNGLKSESLVSLESKIDINFTDTAYFKEIYSLYRPGHAEIENFFNLLKDILEKNKLKSNIHEVKKLYLKLQVLALIPQNLKTPKFIKLENSFNDQSEKFLLRKFSYFLQRNPSNSQIFEDTCLNYTGKKIA
ncbi:hypothetical protein N9L02_00945 [Gammaproteobacteria bacterium]|nr:hypothetical protein [Gammaproteobacteria bacterium]